MNNNNQSNRNYQSSNNQNYQSRRPYAQSQSINQLNHPNPTPNNSNPYTPNNQLNYRSPNNFQNNHPNNYYYPYHYGHYNPHQSHHYGLTPHMYMQPPHYGHKYQQIPQNTSYSPYNRQNNQFQQQNQTQKYNQSQSQKNQYSQSSNQRDLRGLQRDYIAKERSKTEFLRQQQKQACYSYRAPQKKQSNYNQECQDRDIQINSYQSASDSEEEQEEIFYKKKQILKKKDPILDSKEEIRKWIEARKRNYPRKNVSEQEKQKKFEQEQLSILQKKIRKKIVLINSDAKSILKKQKDLDILRRFILYPRRLRKQPKLIYQRKQAGPLVQQIVENEPRQAKQQIQITPQNNIQLEQEVVDNNQEVKEKEINEQDEVVELPIKSNNNIIKQFEKQTRTNEGNRTRREQLSVDVIIKHLQMKQKEDTKVLTNLMNYKTNSFNYRYQHQTLETNLMLENIFKDTSYMLQAIRYIVKNNFFD